MAVVSTTAYTRKREVLSVILSCNITGEEPDKNGKYNCGKVTSDEVIDTAFVEEETEQSSQPGVPQEKATALRYEIKENENVYNAENEEVRLFSQHIKLAFFISHLLALLKISLW